MLRSHPILCDFHHTDHEGDKLGENSVQSPIFPRGVKTWFSCVRVPGETWFVGFGVGLHFSGSEQVQASYSLLSPTY